jgi:hypothetical protein
MIMKKYRYPLAAALVGALALGVAGPALAKHDGYGPPGDGWEHHKHHHHHHGRDVAYYGPPPVLVRPAPVIVPQPVYYEPAYYYPPRRSPSVVIGVDIPPVVIPLR